MFEIAKETNFDAKSSSIKSNTDRILIKLVRSPAIVAVSLKKNPSQKPKEPKTTFSSSNPNEN